MQVLAETHPVPVAVTVDVAKWPQQTQLLEHQHQPCHSLEQIGQHIWVQVLEYL